MRALRTAGNDCGKWTWRPSNCSSQLICLSTDMQSLQFQHQTAASKRKLPAVRWKNHHDAKFEVLTAVLLEASASTFPEFWWGGISTCNKEGNMPNINTNNYNYC
jgi:hypothetical protein